jgi:hypothetical protein
LALFSLPLALSTLVGVIASSIWLSGKGAAISWRRKIPVSLLLTKSVALWSPIFLYARGDVAISGLFSFSTFRHYQDLSGVQA